MATNEAYQAKQFKLSGLQGISDQTLEMHFKLYEGYVKETNRLTEKIWDLVKDGKVDQEEMPAYSELTRRLGFEYNGMVLHEYYFGNMTKGGSGDPGKQSAFYKAAETGFGSYDIWKADFVSIGKMRGVAGRYVSGSKTRAAHESVGNFTRNRRCCGIRAGARDGRMGTRVSARLQAR